MGFLGKNSFSYEPEAGPDIYANVGRAIIDENKINKNLIRKSILEEVEECVCGGAENRNETPESTSGTIADFWNLYLKKRGMKVEISELDVDAMMVLLKLSRIITGYGDIDNWLDIAGYATLGGEAHLIRDIIKEFNKRGKREEKAD